MLKMDEKWWEVGLDLQMVGWQMDEKWWEVGGVVDGWEMVRGAF